MRDSAFLATKFYPTFPAGTVPERHAVAGANRLGTGRIDLYQVHQPRRFTPGTGTMRSIRALQRTGLVGEVGVSNASLDRWRGAERSLGSRVLSNQVGYSLVTRRAEGDILPFAASRDRVVIAYRPLEMGCCPASTTAPTGRSTGCGPPRRCSCRRTWSGRPA
jgi:aryl-alcohol dehydrogenase-like predicted oxidoreductase